MDSQGARLCVHELRISYSQVLWEWLGDEASGPVKPKLKFLFRNPQEIRSIKLKAWKNNMLISLFLKKQVLLTVEGFPGGTVVEYLSASAEDARDRGLIPGLGRSPEIGNGNPPQYSWQGNSMDIGACQAIVHGLAKSWTWLSTHTHTHTLLNITGYHPKVLNFLSVSILIISLEYYKLCKCQCQTLNMIQYSYKMTTECLST